MQALSYCGSKDKPCNHGHEEAPKGSCAAGDKMRCCRTVCGGPGSYCLTETSPCYSADEYFEKGDCPVPGFRCCRPLKAGTEKVKTGPPAAS